MPRGSHNYQDHTGRIYNKITAIRRLKEDPRNKHGTVWLFRCHCGKEFSNYISLIKRGTTRSCGCLKKATRNHRFIDLTGQQFFYLTAVQYAGIHRTKRGSKTMWKFRCVCGKEFVSQISNITLGRIKSCGCKRLELLRRPRVPQDQEVYNRAYTAHTHGALRRGIPTELSKEQYIEIIKKPCEYCGHTSKRKTQRSWAAARLRGESFVELIDANSVDRRNNEPYYRKENSVPACFSCQKMKGMLTATEFLEKCGQVARFSQSR